MTHLHITAWVIAFILLFVVNGMYKKGNNRPGKIIHMILRLDYLLIIATGIILFVQYHSYATYLGELIIKMIAGLWTIIAIEMITVKASKGDSTRSWWIHFIIAALIAIILGFGRLPLGVKLF